MMANRPTAVSQKELEGYAKAMQAANVPVWTVEIVRPDGTRVTVSAGQPQAGYRGASLDRRLGINNG
jgi:hypothetical protein